MGKAACLWGAHNPDHFDKERICNRLEITSAWMSTHHINKIEGLEPLREFSV